MLAVIRRLFLLAAAAILALMGAAWFGDCRQVLHLPLEGEVLRADFLEENPLITQHEDPRNALSAVLGLVYLFLAVMCLNRALRTQQGAPLDRIFRRCGRGLAGLTVPLFLLLLLNALYFSWARVSLHLDGAEAVRAMTEIQPAKIHNAGFWLYAVDRQRLAHIAPVTPAVLRGLDRAGVELPPERTRRMAVPGITPILLLGGIALWGLVRRLREPYSALEAIIVRQARGVALCLITSFYVLFWVTVGNYGNELQIFETPLRYLQHELAAGRVADAVSNDPNDVVNAMMQRVAESSLILASARRFEWGISIVLLAFGMCFLVVAACFKLERWNPFDVARAGWGWYLLLLQVCLFLAVWFAAETVTSPPLILWGSWYLAALGAAWAATQPATVWGSSK